jgi:hypothetical protein
MTTITTPSGIGTKDAGVRLSAALVVLLAMGGIVGAWAFADSGSEGPALSGAATATRTTPALSPADEVQLFKAASTSPRDLALSPAEEVQLFMAASSSARTGLSVNEELQMLREASNG